jgi:hypothetical protein
MPKTKAFNLAELIRHISYNESDDKIETVKTINTEGKKRKNKNFTSTDSGQTLDQFSKSDYQSALYHIAATKGTEFHTSLVLLGHDDTTVELTEYGTLVSNTVLYTVDASISGANVVVTTTPQETNVGVKFSVEFVDA